MADINKLLSDKAITQEQNKVRILNVFKKYSSSWICHFQTTRSKL